VAAAAPYWAGEAEVVRSYWSRRRNATQDLDWLRAQAYKETRLLRELGLDLRDQFLRKGVVRNHPDGPGAARKVAQEMHHFRLLADLIFELSGVAVSPLDVVELPADRTLQESRAAYRMRGDLERAAVAFTEGGGGAMYRVLSELAGDAFERRVAAAFRVIYEDEIVHGPAEIHSLARVARSEDDVLMRNEMFGFPLSPPRIREIDEGKIEPWPIPIPI
jgi:hypothetical protein